MPQYEFITLYIYQQLEPGNGKGPRYVYTLFQGEKTQGEEAQGKVTDPNERQSVESVVHALEAYQHAGWTLLALVLVDGDEGMKIYEVKMRRAVD